MREFLNDNYGSAVPLILGIVGLLASGFWYTVLFIWVAPAFHGLVGDNIYKTAILGFCYALPLLILFVWAVATFLEGSKQNPLWRQ